MMKSQCLVDYEFPYVVLVSRFIDYFGIDMSNEIVDNVIGKTSCEITIKHRKKLGMRYVHH